MALISLKTRTYTRTLKNQARVRDTSAQDSIRERKSILTGEQLFNTRSQLLSARLLIKLTFETLEAGME